jgi:hypothetical protein
MVAGVTSMILASAAAVGMARVVAVSVSTALPRPGRRG